MKRVVLVRPSGPRNVGMILRVARNFGPCELVLVAPARPSILVHPEFEQMSHGAEEAREQIVVLGSLEEALADCSWSVAFTARARGHRLRADWRDERERLTRLGDDPRERLALVFGNEETGLTVEESERAAEIVHVRTAREHTSINLAVTVGIVLHDLFTGQTVWQVERGGNMVSGEAREFLKRRMIEVFAGSVARSPIAAREIAETIERVISRAPLENRDARAWHKMLRALGSRTIPSDLGLEPNPSPRAKKPAADSTDASDEEEAGEDGA